MTIVLNEHVCAYMELIFTCHFWNFVIMRPVNMQGVESRIKQVIELKSVLLYTNILIFYFSLAKVTRSDPKQFLS
jgi:hypothetical protein